MSDREELAGFCAREYPRLVRWLSVYCGDAGLAEEFAQEALVEAVARWPKVRGMAYPTAWVTRVAMNASHGFFRRRRIERRAVARWDALQPAPVVGEPEVGQPRTRLRRAVDELPERQRRALVLRHVGELSVAEVAEVMGLSEQAVRNLTHRATRRLREVLDTQEDAHVDR